MFMKNASHKDVAPLQTDGYKIIIMFSFMLFTSASMVRMRIHPSSSTGSRTKLIGNIMV